MNETGCVPSGRGLKPRILVHCLAVFVGSIGLLGTAHAAVFPPSTVTAAATSCSTTTLSWVDNAKNESGYQVERSLSPTSNFVLVGTLGAGATSYSDSGLVPLTTYYYRVRAFTSQHVSDYGPTASATTWPDTTPPTTAITRITLNASGSNIVSSLNGSILSGVITLAASASDNIGVARVEFYRDNILLVTDTTQPYAAITDTVVSPNGSHTFYTAAYDAAGNRGVSSSVGVIFNNPPPAIPSNLGASTISSSQVNLSWQDNSGSETGFKLERATSSTFSSFTIITVGSNTTAYSNMGLSPNTTYFYRVKSYSVNWGDSAYTAVASATTLPTIPVAPSGLTATATSSSQTILSWIDNSTNETGFNVDRATSSAGPWTRLTTTSANVTSFLVTGLSASTTYFYRVNATNTGGVSAYTAIASATTLPTIPIAPSGLSATATSSSQTILSWIDSSNNETGFNVDRATSSAGPWTRLSTTSANATSFLVTGLGASTTYYYRVNATNAGGASAYTAIVSARTLAVVATAPNAPSGLSANRASSNRMNLRWADNSTNETSFVIQRSTSYGGPWSQVATLGAGVMSYSDGNLNSSTFYCYRTCASNSVGSSSWSNIAGDTTMAGASPTAPAAPGNLTAAAVASNQVNLTWSDNSTNETTFKIERAQSSSGPFAQIATTGFNVTSYNNGGLSASTIYYYRIRASNTVGDSGYSGQAVVSTMTAGAAPPATITTNYFPIPSTHPRLWWNAARLSKARAWYTSHPFTPSSSDPLGCAFRYTMTGEASYARTAINWLMNYTIPQAQLDGTASDNARWDGENAALVYDWCHAQMTAAERATILVRWNSYLDILRNKSWGGVGMEMNNYYWGYLRNELEWGIATSGESSMASSFLTTALVTRWQNSFVPFAASSGKGGVLHEGPGYGAVTAWYPIIPFGTATFLGRNLWNESPFFKEMIFYIIYATTPAPTSRKADTAVTYEMFPFNDCEYPDTGSVFKTRKYYGDAMNVLANQWSSLAVGQYARRWINRVAPSVSSHVTALDNGGTERDFGLLSLDYHAPGHKFLFARNNWGTGTTASPTTALHLLLGRPKGVGHAHREAGSFQLWRNGRWVSRNTSGYADTITGFGGSSVDVSQPSAKNVLLINGIGQLPESWVKGDAIVLRLESKPAYLYAAVDLTQLHKANADFAGRVAEAPVISYVREFVFVRSTETLYVCDRINAGSGSVTASFLLHSEQPTPLFTTTAVVGTPVATRTVSEGSTAVAQTRFEYDYTITGQNHVVRKITPLGVTDGNSVQFNSTLGGTFNGTAFSSGVQSMIVTDNGPVWQ